MGVFSSFIGSITTTVSSLRSIRAEHSAKQSKLLQPRSGSGKVLVGGCVGVAGWSGSGPLGVVEGRNIRATHPETTPTNLSRSKKGNPVEDVEHPKFVWQDTFGSFLLVSSVCKRMQQTVIHVCQPPV